MFKLPAGLTLLYTLAIAGFMVSRIPVFSGKKMGQRVSPEMLLPLIVVIVLFFALLISYPFEVLTVGVLAYLASLPFGWMSYRKHELKSAGNGSPVVQPQVAAADMADTTAPAGDTAERGGDGLPTTRH